MGDRQATLSGSHDSRSGFNQSLFTITHTSTPDPFVVYWNSTYYMTWTAGDRVEIWSSSDLLQLGRRYYRTVVWRAPREGPYAADIWAPELHSVEGRWYIYVACADPKHGNKSHRMCVLRGPRTTDPPDDERGWQFLGPLAGLPSHQWAIDGTILPIRGTLYFVYSGWPLDDRSQSDKTQQLFIASMSSATQVSSQPTLICHPRETWECSGPSRIAEGPQVLASPDGSWVGIAYSCAGSWTAEYKMNTLRFTGGDPLDARSWRKSHRPLLTSHSRRAPYGPGHGCFLNVGRETWAVFHATDGPADGWEGRKARVQRVRWGTDGPDMGGVCGQVVRSKEEFLSQRVNSARGGDASAGGPSAGRRSGLEGMVGRLKEGLLGRK